MVDNVGSTHYKNASMSSLSISTVTSKTATLTNQSAEANNGKRMESLTDEEIIQKNIRELMDKKNRVSFRLFFFFLFFLN